jgi:hypothetical protein
LLCTVRSNLLAVESGWLAALIKPGMLMLGLVAVGSALGLAWMLLRLARNHQPKGRPDPEAGTATIEFTLAFPVVLVLALLLLQTTLVMVGNVFVHYAAFSGARAAIVQIPRALPEAGEPRNTIDLGAESAKFQAIERAVYFSVLPVAGQGRESAIADQALAQAVGDFYAQSAATAPGWIDNLAAGKARYAARHTDVTLMRVNNLGQRATFEPMGDGRHTFTPRAPVTVQVRHALNLPVPYVRLLFADGQHTTASGPTGYTTITVHQTLTNEGVDRRLPDPPLLPRRNVLE